MPGSWFDYVRFGVVPRHPDEMSEEGANMLAAIGLGFIGTILVIVLVIAAIMFFVRRA